MYWFGQPKRRNHQEYKDAEFHNEMRTALTEYINLVLTPRLLPDDALPA